MRSAPGGRAGSRSFSQRQVNASAGDRRQRLDRARQLAFQATLIVQLLLELGQPEFLPLEQLEADDGALWKTLRSQLRRASCTLSAGTEWCRRRRCGTGRSAATAARSRRRRRDRTGW